MFIQALRQKSIARTVLVGILISMMTPFSAWSSTLAKPTDRWLKQSGSVMHNLPATARPVTIDDELPDLNPNVRVGQVIVSQNGATMTVKQSTDRALIDWATFNIGTNNTVRFDQPGADSVALNRIFQQSPSKIFGQLQANGNVWLYNPNGIFFGKDSQVNVRGLIASSMEFNGLDATNFATADLFGALDKGLPFLTNARLMAEGTTYCANSNCSIALDSDPTNPICTGSACNQDDVQSIIQGGAQLTCTGPDCRRMLPRIIVEKGATVTTSPGGQLMMAAPEVVNEGSLQAGDGGQVVLAGSKKDLYLAVTSSEDTDLRGFIVEVDSGVANPEGGAVVNAGDVTANLGNVTLVAKEIVQAGQLRSSTAVDVNGSIRLISRDGSNALAGNIVTDKSSRGVNTHRAYYLDRAEELPETQFDALGKNPGTVIMQDGSSIDIAIDNTRGTANDSLAQASSRVNIEGKEVYMGKGATIVAPGAEVTVRAHIDPTNVNQSVDPNARFIMDDAAVIDVSGTTDTVLEASRNNLEFFVTSNELKDSPQQKNGPLLRKTVKVDIRRGTPLFDWTTGLATVEKSASERTAAGGNIDIKAGAVDLGAGATLDVSGGYVAYKGGFVESSKLAGNGAVDIADVDVDLPYKGLAFGEVTSVVDPKWGQRDSFRPGTSANRYYRDAYVQGDDAGYLRIFSGQELIDPSAKFLAGVTTGPYQRTAATAPTGGVLAFDAGTLATDFYIHNDLDDFGSSLSLSEVRLLASQLESSGANKILINTSGVVNLGTQQNPLFIDLGVGHSDGVGRIANVYSGLVDSDFQVSAGGIHQYGGIRAASAAVTFNQRDITANNGRVGDGILLVDGTIDTRGHWINDQFTKGVPLARLRIDGGDVSLRSEETLQVTANAFVSTDAGAWIDRKDNLAIGDAGDIELRNSSLANNSAVTKQAVVDIKGRFSALDGADGGVLTVEAENFSIGGSQSTSLVNNAVVGNDFFTQTDVGGYRFIAGNGNVIVKDDANIDLSHKVLVDPSVTGIASQTRVSSQRLSAKRSADNVAGVLNRTQWQGPDRFRAAPGSLQLDANRPRAIAADEQKGIVELRAGSVITGPARSSVAINSTNRSLIDGLIAIAGGTLSATNSTVSNGSFQEDADLFTYILMGDNAVVDLSATAIPVPTNPLFDQYQLVDAGTVNLTAEVGSVIVAAGAEVNLSGATVQPKTVNSTRAGASGFGGRILNRTITQTPPAQQMRAGNFNLLAEKGFALANVVNFGQAAGGGASPAYAGGSLNLALTYYTGREVSTNAQTQPTLDKLEIALGDTSGLAALSGFAFDDALPIGYIQNSTTINGREYVTGTGKGFVASGNLSANHLDQLTINTQNSQCCSSQQPAPLQALSSISVQGDIDLAANSAVYVDAGWLNISDGSSLDVSAPYVRLGESTNVSTFSGVTEATAIQQLLPTAPSDLKGGTGRLGVNSQILDLIGNLAVTGTDTVTFNASSATRLRSVANIDGQFSPSQATPMANRLDVFGDTQFNTPLLYATTLSDYTINRIDAGQIEFNGYIDPVSGARVGISEPVLSYGGSIAVNADDISIDTAIVSPFGSIDINAVNNPLLQANAYLGVAALDGTRIPFGKTQGGVSWVYRLAEGSRPLRFTSTGESGTLMLPEKVIRISGKVVDSEIGSRIDLSGGGEVFATEFVAGLGGSQDILSNRPYTERFVLVPSLKSGFAPFDFVASRNSQIPYGTTLEISGSGNLPDGRYTVLPASYAFLQNAYVVTPESVSVAVTPGYRDTTLYGAEIVAGRFTNSLGAASSNWQAFRVDPGFRVVGGAVNDSRAEYRFTTLDSFFAPSAPGVLPQENGRLAIDVVGNIADQLSLVLASTILSSPQSRVGSSVDIKSNQAIVISSTQAPSPGTLLIDSQLIDSTGADSVLIGGSRSWSFVDQGWQVATSATSVSVDGAALDGEEILLTANNRVSLENGASINTSGNSSFVGNKWLADNNAATLLSSTSTQSRLQSTDGVKNYGSLDTSGGTINTDGTLAVAYDGVDPLSGVTVSQARLQVFSDTITLGTGAGVTLDQSLLQSATLLELEANSLLQVATDISVANLQEATLRTAQVDVADGVSFSLAASKQIVLQGVSGASGSLPQTASSMNLQAPEIILAAPSDQSVAMSVNSAAVTLDASQALVTRGDVQFNAAGDVTVNTPIVLSRAVGEAEITAANSLKLVSSTGGVVSPPSEFAAGNVFRFSAADLLVDTTVWAPAGMIAGSSTGDITIGSNADLVVPSIQAVFPDSTIDSREGVISFVASNDLSVADASAFNFGVDGNTTNGGLLELLAGGVLSVTTPGAAVASDSGRDISLQGDTLDIASLLWFNQSGFDRSVSAVTTGAAGDLVLGTGETIQARDLLLAATQADVTLGSGSAINVAGNQRKAKVYAGNNLDIANGASLSVTALNGQGGDLSLQTPGGEMTIDPGATIYTDGDLEIVADYSATATDVQLDAGDTIGGKLGLYLAQTFSGTSFGTADLSKLTQAVADAAAATTSSFINQLPDFVRPLVEIYSSGDLDISEAVDLASVRAVGEEPGRLVLRAAGDINISGSLSDGTGALDPATTGLMATTYLREDESWDMELAAGAIDARGLAMADLTAGTAGNISLGNGSFIRTGTGNIVVASSGDVSLGVSSQDKAYIATMGRAEHTLDLLGILLPSWNGQQYLDIYTGLPEFSGFSLEAGDVFMDVGGDLKGFADGGLTSASFIRSVSEDTYSYVSPGFVNADFTGRKVRALAIDAIKTGVHSVGGGNVIASVRGDINRLGFSTPGVASGATANGELDYSIMTSAGPVSGLGGVLDVSARGDITHSAFSNDGSAISVNAGGSIGEDVSSGIGTFVSGSYTDITFNAGRNILLEGIANTTVMPFSQSQMVSGFMLNTKGNPVTAADQAVAWFFSGYDVTSLELNSVAGEIRFDADYAAVNSILGQDLTQVGAGGTAHVSGQSNERRFRLLPSKVSANALGGDIVIGNSVALFPDQTLDLALRAQGSLRPEYTGAGSLGDLYIYLPDFDASLFPTALQPYAVNTFGSDSFGTTGAFAQYNNPNERLRDDYIDPRTSLTQRDENLSLKLYALSGSIGDEDNVINLEVISPIRVDAVAGNNIKNVTFDIQHSNAGDISQIQAGNDFEYTLEYSNNSLVDAGSDLFVKVAGPGELIVSAGGDIDLGASGGIFTIGNQENPFLPDQGASIHLFSGYSGSQTDFSRLVGDGVSGVGDLSGIASSLNISSASLNTLTLNSWFQLLAGMPGSNSNGVVTGAVTRATGNTYQTVGQAISAWNGLDDTMRLRTSVYAIKELALSNPALLVNKGNFLFNKRALGQQGFSSSQERQNAFTNYWDGIAALIALDKMLTPERIGDLQAQGVDIPAFSALTLDQQLNTTVAAFGALGQAKQLLVAESILNHQVRQSGIEAANAGRTLAGFERGFVALRRFYGDDLDAALISSALRTRNIQRGGDESIKPGELSFGGTEGISFNSFTDVLAFWERDSGDDFNLAEIQRLLSVNSLDQLSQQERSDLESRFGTDLSLDPDAFVNGNISLVFSAVKSSAPGASINFNVPAGEVDVGLSADLIKSLNVKYDEANDIIFTDQLGVIVEFFGDINANVASGFNVNESRAFSLAGGAVNLWATWGDIDAGKGAKTAVTTPEARFVVSPNSGAITKVTPPAVSGSGIKTDERRLASSSALTSEQRFYQVATGAGPAYLATPLGVVDAGEAGIDSAGNLFIAAQQVRGADNISVGGVSVGVSSTTSVSANVASAGDSSSQATSAVSDSVSGAAGDQAATTTAFVTIELLDTGIGFGSGPSSSADVCNSNSDDC